MERFSSSVIGELFRPLHIPLFDPLATYLVPMETIRSFCLVIQVFRKQFERIRIGPHLVPTSQPVLEQILDLSQLLINQIGALGTEQQEQAHMRQPVQIFLGRQLQLGFNVATDIGERSEHFVEWFHLPEMESDVATEIPMDLFHPFEG